MSSSIVNVSGILNNFPFDEGSSHAVAKTFKDFNLQIPISFNKRRNSFVAWISSKNCQTEPEQVCYAVILKN